MWQLRVFKFIKLGSHSEVNAERLHLVTKSSSHNNLCTPARIPLLSTLEARFLHRQARLYCSAGGECNKSSQADELVLKFFSCLRALPEDRPQDEPAGRQSRRDPIGLPGR